MSKKTILLSTETYAAIGQTLASIAYQSGHEVEFLSDDVARQQPPAGGVEAAFFTRDIFQGSTRSELQPRAQHFFDLLSQSKRLQWLHVFSSGADRAQYKVMQAAGVQITTSAGGNASAVASLALAGILALNKKMPMHWNNQRQQLWSIPEPSEFPRSMVGQTAVIVGTGHIGCLLARYLHVLGVRTVGINRSGREVDEFDVVLPTAALLEQVAHADWLVVCCPLTEKTRHLVGANILDAMPKHAYLINVGRAAIVDQAALLECLRTNQIAGAHLDVFDPEPLSTESEFWQLDNLIITPHAGAQSTGIEESVNQLFVENFRRWLLNEPLNNLVK